MTDKQRAALAEEVSDIYRRKAVYFDGARDRSLFEKSWLDRFLAALPTQPRVLDLGCGTGRPIADYLTRQGARVTGLDVSPEMLELARGHAPQGDWRLGDMRSFDLGMQFDGVISFDAFFHLTPDAQRSTLARIADHLKLDGMLLLTVGPDDGEAIGQMEDAPLYHASLSPDGYVAALSDVGLTRRAFQPEDADCKGRSVLLAQKLQRPSR